MLERAVRVCGLEGFQVVLAIDDCQAAGGSGGDLAPDLARLSQLGSRVGRGLTLVEVRQDDPDQPAIEDEGWVLSARLRTLTQSEVEDYLLRKLAAAGCQKRVFTSRAITRLQSLAAGVPRNLERLATLSLSAAAVRGLEVVSPDLVDGVARQWLFRPH